MTHLIVSLRRAFALSRVLYSVALLTVGVICTLASPAWAAETFGVEDFESSVENQDHSLAVQAGSHPYALTTTIMFNHRVTRDEEEEQENAKEELVPTGEPEVSAEIYGSPKDLEVNLPVGLVVNPNATKVKCTEAQLEEKPSSGGGCPDASAVGIDIPSITPNFGEKLRSAVYNMVPPLGVPAEFGINPGGVGFIIHVVGRVRTGSDYGLTGEVSDITQKVGVYGVKLTLWGDPSDASHDAQRGICATRGTVIKEIEQEFFEKENRESGKISPGSEYRFSCPAERTNKPLLTTPGSCTGEALEATMSADAWGKEPPNGVIRPPPATSPAMTGCEKLDFSPSLNVKPTPESPATESPSGLSVDLKIPQEENAGGLAEANLKKAVVTLPTGMAVSPSAANGLGACTPAEIGLSNAEKPSCPDSSKVGEAEVITPLLETPLKGAVYLAQQETFKNSLIGLYLVAEGSGALIKLGGEVVLNASTGQITATFDNNPQLPFNDLKLEFFGGPKAPLITPAGCGAYMTTSQLFAYSGRPPAEPSSSFAINQGCGAGGFSPAFTAGTANNQAGGYSPFSLTFSRRDGEQRFSSASVTLPPGLLAKLAGVPLCPDTDANAGSCPVSTQVGTVTAGAGPGSDPYFVTGQEYLTGPYKGGPYGLVDEVPAVAGPFNLGTVVVRQSLHVDPHTGRVTAISDPFPTILDGIPLDIRTINVTTDRSEFTFNPTNCAPLAVTGTIGSTEGVSTGVSSPFQTANCANLPFKPSFKAGTQAKTSKAKGASLTVRVGSGTGQANIAKVRVLLPKQLPARLTTLQKACTEAQFNIDPAGCPAASAVGTATAATPVLAHPLTGPAYLVSHGGAAFPDVVFVLQGEGIVLYLDGNTNIKKGITSSTFNSVPDAPISTFETVFPEGPHSVLATNIPAKAKSSMCGQSLTLPTAITGQNGAVVTQTTKIAVTGCPKKPKAKKTGKKKKK